MKKLEKHGKKVQNVSKHKKISVLGLNFAWYFVKKLGNS